MSDVTFDHARKTNGLVALNRAKLAEQMAWLQTALPSSKNGNGSEMLASATGADAAALRIITSIVFCHNDLLRCVPCDMRWRGTVRRGMRERSCGHGGACALASHHIACDCATVATS